MESILIPASIPDGWVVRPLGKIVDFLNNRCCQVKCEDRAKMKGDIPYYGASGVIDYVNGYIFDEDLILLGKDGENIISRVKPLAFKISGKAWVNDHAHVLKPKDFVSIGYLVEYLESLNYEHINSGSAQPGLSKRNCLTIPVVLPSNKIEQELIAEALNDVNTFICELQKILYKKRLIKQGVLQELLSGEKRLPRFSGERETHRLGEFGICLRGVSYDGNIDLYQSDNQNAAILLRANNIRSAKINFTDIQYVNKVCVSDTQYLNTDDIIICMANGSKELIGKSAFYNFENNNRHTFGAFMGCFRVFNKEQAIPKYIFYLLNSNEFRKQINTFLVGSSINNLTPKSIENISFSFHRVKEQSVISEILSDMDDEILAFEEKLAKFRQIKQSMAQNLLTGRMRLI